MSIIETIRKIQHENAVKKGSEMAALQLRSQQKQEQEKALAEERVEKYRSKLQSFLNETNLIGILQEVENNLLGKKEEVHGIIVHDDIPNQFCYVSLVWDCDPRKFQLLKAQKFPYPHDYRSIEIRIDGLTEASRDSNLTINGGRTVHYYLHPEQWRDKTVLENAISDAFLHPDYHGKPGPMEPWEGGYGFS